MYIHPRQNYGAAAAAVGCCPLLLLLQWLVISRNIIASIIAPLYGRHSVILDSLAHSVYYNTGEREIVDPLRVYIRYIILRDSCSFFLYVYQSYIRRARLTTE